MIRKPRIGYLTDFFRANSACTTSHSRPTIRSRSSAVATSATNTSAPRRVRCLSISTSWLSVRLSTRSRTTSIVIGRPLHPIRLIASSIPLSPAQIAEVSSAALRVEHDPAALAYTSAIRDSPFVRAVVERRLDFEWAVTHMISDDPAKGLGRAPPEKLFHEQLREIIGDPVSDLELVASYLVPGNSGTESFISMAKRGVKIKILTNSLEARTCRPSIPALLNAASRCSKPESRFTKCGVCHRKRTTRKRLTSHWHGSSLQPEH